MILLINRKKLDAASNSMHQFCQEVRSIFPGPVENDLTETATIFLYLRVADDIFGHRFRGLLARRLGERLKYDDPKGIRERLARIQQRADALEKGKLTPATARDPEEKCRIHVTSVIESLLIEGGFNCNDQEAIREGYGRFEAVIRDMKRHLEGIRHQNNFLLKKAG